MLDTSFLRTWSTWLRTNALVTKTGYPRAGSQTAAVRL